MPFRRLSHARQLRLLRGILFCRASGTVKNPSHRNAVELKFGGVGKSQPIDFPFRHVSAQCYPVTAAHLDAGRIVFIF